MTVSTKSIKSMYKKLLQSRIALLLFGSMLLAILGNSSALAQGVTTSSINGVVSDDKGGALPGATVVAIHTPSGTKYGITTNNQGRYNFPAVRIGGPYEVTVTFVGFQEQKREIVSADLGTPVQANFKLLEEGKQLSEVVITSQRGSIMDSDRTGASTNIKRESFERLPTISRSFSDFSALTPQAGPGFSFGGRSNLYNNFSIDGATSNNVFGLSATPGGQSNSQPIGVDAIQEISVALAPYDVSQGSFTGAGVNAVTRSGTNQVQGSIYGFSKNQSLVSKQVAGVELPLGKFDYTNWGGRVGGAIIKNKLFYFANVEYEASNVPGVNFPADGRDERGVAFQQTSAQLQTLRDFLVTPNNGKSWTFDPGTFGQFNVPTRSLKVLGKIDWNINDQHKFTIRYNQLNSFRDVAVSGSGGFGSAPPGGRQNSNNALPFSGSWYRINNNMRNIIGELNSSFASGKFANQLQLGYSAFRDFREASGGGAVAKFPTVDIVGPNGQTLTSFGPDPFTPNNLLSQDVIQLNNKFDAFFGDHTVTIGTANEFYQFRNVFTQQINGVYQYNSVNDFIQNVTAPTAATAANTAASNSPTQYLSQYSAILGDPAPAANWNASQLGFYIQDSYSGIKNLRLTAGIRMDIPMFPGNNLLPNSRTDTTRFIGGEQIIVNRLPKATPLFSPRVGFNWDVKGDKSLQVRGGTGIFTGRIPFVWISNQVSNNGVFFGTINGTRTGTGIQNTGNTPFNPDPVAYVPQLQPFTGAPVAPTFSINATIPNFRFPQVWRSSLGIDKTLGKGFILTLESIYTKDINAIWIRNANLSPAIGTVAGDGRPLFGNANASATIAPPNDRRFVDYVDQALVLDNTNKGYAWSSTVQVQKTSGRLNGSIAYTYTDSKDLNGQGGSTAGGLWTGNAIVNGPNTPNLSFANNWFPHRFVGFASYRMEYANKKLATTVSLIYEGRNAGNFSYVYGGSPNSDGVNNNDLIYVPRTQSEILLTTTNAQDVRTPQQIWDQLNAFIEQDPYLSKRRGQFAERNAALSPWVNFLNMRVLQDFSVNIGGKRNTLQASLEVNNVLNFLNTDWGLLKTPVRTNLLGFSTYETPAVSTAPTDGTYTRRPIYTFATNPDGSALTDSFINNVGVSNAVVNSRWQVQLGLRYIFN